MSAPPSGGSTPTPTRPPAQGGTPAKNANANIMAIVGNIPNLLAMDRAGKLTQVQINQLRQLIQGHTRQIVLASTSKSAPNPLLNLSPRLNPSLPWEHGPAIISEQDFKNNIQAAVVLANNVVAQARSTAPSTPNPNANATASASAGPSRPGSSAGPAVRPSGAATAVRPPAATGQAGGSDGGGITMATSAPPGIFSPAELKEWLKIDQARRAEILSANQAVHDKFRASLHYYSMQSKSNSAQQQQNQQSSNANVNANANQARPPAAPGAPSAPATSASTSASVSASQQPSHPHPATHQPSLANAPPPVPAAPPVPVESEPDRRRRKFAEYLRDEAPGLEYEMGVQDIMGELLDSFTQDVARGAMRLARHRGSDKVDIKDMAFILDKEFGITVPGFNLQPVERSHIAAEGERKRARVVAPRAVRAGAGGGKGNKEDES